MLVYFLKSFYTSVDYFIYLNIQRTCIIIYYAKYISKCMHKLRVTVIVLSLSTSLILVFT